MVNLKTKIDKHANDNEKRCKSIKEKEKAKFNQSKIIKQALSNSNLGNNSCKKIIFSDESDSKDTSRNEFKSNGKFVLFDNSDSENDDAMEIREKTQFSGKKGFELLNLQSTYGNDERFKIDERFLEDEANDEKVAEKNIDSENVLEGEKAQQLKILEGVLGTSFASQEKEKKTKKRTFEMIRYDVSNKDHKIYEKNTQNETGNSIPSKKRKEDRRSVRTEKEELSKPKVSKDKFYEVSSEIRSHFKEKQDEGAQFSLLQTYGLNEFGKDKEFQMEFEKEKNKEGFEEFGEVGSEFEEGSHKEEEMLKKEPREEEKSVTAKGIWKESFFFVQDDVRFKEGLEFINKKESPEAIEAAENYDKTRKVLKEILRLHLKKQMHKKDPFKNKIGGMNKKQLNSSKSKNHKMLFNNKKTTKKNHDKTV